MSNLCRSVFLFSTLSGLLLACGDDDSPSDMRARTNAGDIVDDADAGTDGSLEDADSGAEAALDASPPVQGAFSLDFAAVSGGKTVGCGDTLTGLGLDGTSTASIDDLRLYVSNLQFHDTAGAVVELRLDRNDFQYLDDAGNVSLIDLTSNEVGACNPDNFPESEGTRRVHTAITGSTFIDKVASITFDVGLPQALMKKVIANNTAEGAPSPLAEMSWTWAGGYRFFVWNFLISKAGDAAQSDVGYVHVGSTGCSASFEANALSDRDACARLNTPAVALRNFSLASNKITIDLDAIVKKLDFMSETYDDQFQVNGSAPGIGCHSGASAADCSEIFPAFGLSLETGAADASKNTVFGVGTK
jgi:uncharacterized repeat protein (TIGR04052 family)